MFIHCMRVLSQTLFCKAKHHPLERLLSHSFIFSQSLFSAPPLCSFSRAQVNPLAHVTLSRISQKCQAQCQAFLTASTSYVIPRASLGLILLFLWLNDVSALWHYGDSPVPHSHALISALSCVYHWIASFFCYPALEAVLLSLAFWSAVSHRLVTAGHQQTSLVNSAYAQLVDQVVM